MNITLGTYKNLGFRKPEIVVRDEEYQASLDNIRNSLAKWEDDDGLTRIGSKITIDYIVTHEGTLIPDGKGDNLECVIGEGRLQGEVEKSLVNLNKGETHSFEIALPETYEHEWLQGEIVNYEVKIKKVQKLNYPHTLDEIIEQLQDEDLNDVGQLEKRLKDEIYAYKYKISFEKLVENIVTAIVDASNVLIEQDEVKKESTVMYNKFINNLKREKVAIEAYYVQNKVTPNQFKKQFLKNAEEQIVTNATLDKIAKEEKITINENELQSKKYKYLYENNLNEEDFEDGNEDFEKEVLRQKTIKFLTRINTV